MKKRKGCKFIKQRSSYFLIISQNNCISLRDSLTEKFINIKIDKSKKKKERLTLSWRRSISYRNQSIDLGSKSMDWFLYDNGLRHERVKITTVSFNYQAVIYLFKTNGINIRSMNGNLSKLTIKISDQWRWIRSGVFIVNFKQI